MSSSKLRSPAKRVSWVLLALFSVTMVACIRWTPWLHIDRVDTSDFEDVRSAILPDIDELFDEAHQEFERGEYWFILRQDNVYDRYGVSYVHIVQFRREDGTDYEVLFMFSGVRGFGEGYYYTPSGEKPPGAPTYGVVCSKQVDEYWYAFNTVDSDNPPKRKNCPQDTQYQ